MKDDCHDDRYKKQIERLRKKMVQAGIAYGLNHPKVLEYSQKIDLNHNRLLRGSAEKNNPPSSSS